MANWRLMQTNQPLDWRTLRMFYLCFVCAERRFQFSRQEIFLFYLCWRKINVVIFNVVYFVIWTGTLRKWFPGAHILWWTIPCTPTFFIFDPKGRHEAHNPPRPPPPTSLKGLETVAMYPSLLRIFDLHFFIIVWNPRILSLIWTNIPFCLIFGVICKTLKKTGRAFRNIGKNI